MVDKQLLPVLPLPPAQYDRVYMESLVRAIEIHFLQGAEPGDMRAAKMAATQLPTTGGALRDGDIFDDGGILKIIRSGDSYSGTAVGTTAVGTVTISIS
jgi:hypothetical protein|tara:strand:- start:1328 stop:1624 length:297 start_codon:yes stop_codon:yes gene_type:complete